MFTPRRLVLALLTAGTALLLGACNTFQSRTEEKAAVFAALDPATQTRLKARQLQVGDNGDMVYIALGTPDVKREILDTNGRALIWIYNTYYQDYQGTRFTGYRRSVAYNPTTKSYFVTLEPDYQPTYQTRVEPRIRVTFRDGRVTVIEQTLQN